MDDSPNLTMTPIAEVAVQLKLTPPNKTLDASRNCLGIISRPRNTETWLQERLGNKHRDLLPVGAYSGKYELVDLAVCHSAPSKVKYTSLQVYTHSQKSV